MTSKLSSKTAITSWLATDEIHVLRSLTDKRITLGNLIGTPGATGQIQYMSATGLTGDANLTWDATTGLAVGKPLTVTSTTAPFLLKYDAATNYCTFAVSPTGDLEITPTGRDVRIFHPTHEPGLYLSHAGTFGDAQRFAKIAFHFNDTDIGPIIIDGLSVGANRNAATLRFWTKGVADGSTQVRMTILSTGLVGIGTTAPDKKLEINSATGDCLRLTYDDADGTATNKVDFAVGATGDLTITPSSNLLHVAASIYPVTDDTYYLGKNDDDTPKAWKGVIVKDTANGKYYRIQVTNGTVTAADLTD